VGDAFCGGQVGLAQTSLHDLERTARAARARQRQGARGRDRPAHLAEPGMPAVLGGPHGRFDHHRGGPRQLWIAGGVGATPFLSWVRAAEHDGLPSQVDFFYSNAGIPPFAAEPQAAASRHQAMRLHLDQHTRGGPPQRPARSADPRRRPPGAGQPQPARNVVPCAHLICPDPELAGEGACAVSEPPGDSWLLIASFRRLAAASGLLRERRRRSRASSRRWRSAPGPQARHRSHARPPVPRGRRPSASPRFGPHRV
jgi:hypothetical protein